MTRTPPAFGTPATRLHAGRILLVLTLLVGAALTAWIWVFHKGGKVSTVATESSTNPGWTASQLHYEKPEVKAEVPAPKPVDMTAAELAKLRAMLAQMQAEIDALKNRKPPAATTVVQQQPKSEPPKKVPGAMLFVHHDVKDASLPPRIRQLTTPVDNSLADAPELVTVHDPTHPLYGRRFLVASRPTRPDAQGTHLLVFLQDTVQLRLPLRVTLPGSTAQTVTKLTPDAVADLLATAHACGIWPSDPQPSGDASPTTSNRPSWPISKPLSAR